MGLTAFLARYGEFMAGDADLSALGAALADIAEKRKAAELAADAPHPRLSVSEATRERRRRRERRRLH